MAVAAVLVVAARVVVNGDQLPSSATRLGAVDFEPLWLTPAGHAGRAAAQWLCGSQSREPLDNAKPEAYSLQVSVFRSTKVLRERTRRPAKRHLRR